MNNLQYSTYISSPYQFQVYSIQKFPVCIRNKKTFQIRTSNDGNNVQLVVGHGKLIDK